MNLPTLSANQAGILIQQGAIVIDIRSPDEFARAHIANAKNSPLDTLSTALLPANKDDTVIFYCRSGIRTQTNADRLASLFQGKAFILEGGIDAWKKAKQPLVTDTSQPLELQRQVQIGAGSLALAGFILGLTVSPYFHMVSGFVGAGLLVAGLTGFCGLARILMHMPWNKR